jgi:hypothetical protein
MSKIKTVLAAIVFCAISLTIGALIILAVVFHPRNSVFMWFGIYVGIVVAGTGPYYIAMELWSRFRQRNKSGPQS